MWHQSLGHTAISDLKTDGSILYVFVDGAVEALRANGEGVIWRSALLPAFSQLEMSNTTLKAVSNGIVYVAGGNGSIYALRATGGMLLWRHQATSGTLFGSFSIQGNALYVGILPISDLNVHHIRSSALSMFK